MNPLLRKIMIVLLYPFSFCIRMVQNKMDFLRTYRLKLIIAKVLRIIRIFNGSAASVEFPDTFYPSVHPGTTKKIGFIDHSYHYKTGSPNFFIDLLKQTGSVRVLWDSQWNGGKVPTIERINQEEFDILILWQIMIYYRPGKLQKLNCKNVIIIPMYDDIHNDPDNLFLRFKDFRFISFCKNLHQRFGHLGIRSRYFQYFMDPSNFPHQQDSFSELRGFFWQRTNDITWDHIKKLIEGSTFTSFHLHLALDPIWYHPVLPTEEEINNYHITISHWFDKKEEYFSVFSKANVFFIPRLYEGIGMPVIEAMTMGKVVVAPDHPAMNEYITHGETGILYDINELRPLNFSATKTIASNARNYCIRGFESWKNSLPELLKWLDLQ